ncbi:MAG: hypothetical protein QM757_39180 [Paludibaculum sp.]
MAGLMMLGLGLRLGAQPLASQPELCGNRESGVVAPLGVTAVSEESSGTLVTMQLAKSVVTIQMPVVSKVEQVCPDVNGKLLFFGRLTEISYDIYIVDPVDGAVLDTIRATTPAISPDRRWLAYRAFWPRFSDLEPSEEYLLYDLTVDAARNTAAGTEADQNSGRGFVLYPRIAGGKPFSHAGLPPGLTHVFRADALRWSDDSKSVIFADSVQDKVSIVWVEIGQSSRDLAHRVLPVIPADVCGTIEGWNASDGPWYPTLTGVSRSDGRITLDIQTAAAACGTKSWRVTESDFQAATLEVHPTLAGPLRESIRLN